MYAFFVLCTHLDPLVHLYEALLSRYAFCCISQYNLHVSGVKNFGQSEHYILTPPVPPSQMLCTFNSIQCLKQARVAG